jgi:hypothetical protein
MYFSARLRTKRGCAATLSIGTTPVFRIEETFGLIPNENRIGIRLQIQASRA